MWLMLKIGDKLRVRDDYKGTVSPDFIPGSVGEVDQVTPDAWGTNTENYRVKIDKSKPSGLCDYLSGDFKHIMSIMELINFSDEKTVPTYQLPKSLYKWYNNVKKELT
jgi:hypothetical protein